MAAILGQQQRNSPDGTAIAFTERMHGIELRDHLRQRRGETVDRRCTYLGYRDPPQNFPGFLFDILRLRNAMGMVLNSPAQP